MNTRICLYLNAGVDEGDELAGELSDWLCRRGYGNDDIKDLEATPARSFVTVAGLEIEEDEGATPRDWLLAIVELDEPREVILPRTRREPVGARASDPREA